MRGRSRSKIKGTGRKTFAIVVDGETERWYLQMLHRNEKIKGISIQPELPTKKNSPISLRQYNPMP
jgi:hypothetical protein